VNADLVLPWRQLPWRQKTHIHDRSHARDRLAGLLGRAAAGEFPPADGTVEILAQPTERDAGVIALTAFTVVFADTDPGWISAELPTDDLSAPLTAKFLHSLGQRIGRESQSVDMLTCAGPLPGPPPTELKLTELKLVDPGVTASARAAAAGTHARIARALRCRDDVRAWQTAGGVVMLGRGVAGRWEVAIEVDPQYRGAGLGSALAAAARHLVPDGEAVWAQIAPGNAASVRAFLRAGFRPIGAEVLLAPAQGHADAELERK
jgi:GNAT superfamily N-acetyltransferase